MFVFSGCGGGGGGRGGAASTCASHQSRMCYVNSVYWYDSCGNREGLVETCSTSETCSGGVCTELWEKTFGGIDPDRSSASRQTADGGYVVAGYTQSYGAGSSDFWIVKVDAAGDQAWEKSYGGTERDEATSIQQTADGGYIVAGYTQSYGAGDSDFWVMKLDSSGNQEWEETFGGTGVDEANSVEQTADGGYIVAGHTRSHGSGNSDFWVMKLDSSGGQTWEKTFGGEQHEVAESVAQTADGGYIVAGRTLSLSSNYGEFYIVKLDSSGGTSWEKTFGGDDHEGAYAIQQTADGGYVAAGYTYSHGSGVDDFWIVKLDSSGNEEWNSYFGGANSDAAYSIIQTADGGYIAAGETTSFGHGSTDAWVVKLTSSGQLEWSKAYGGMNSDWATSILQTSDGDYLLTGSTYSSGAGSYDFWVVKMGADGMSESCPFACCRSSDCSGVTAYCKDAGSVAARCVECTSNSQCQDGVCADNVCTLCVERSYKDCASATLVYWYDSCGNRGERYQQCATGETCSNGMCVQAETEETGYFGGSGYDVAQSLRLTSDEGFIVAGLTKSFGAEETDVYVVKVDRKGGKDWENHFGGPAADGGVSAAETSDGGYIVAGQTASYGAGGYDLWVLKLDSYGEKLWAKTFGGASADAASSIMQTSDGGYAAGGYTYSFGAGGADYYLVKLDSSGGTEWEKTFGGPSNDAAMSVRHTSDGGYVMAGYTYSFGAGSADAWVVKTDSSGVQEWAKAFGGANFDRAGSVRQTAGGGYVVAGHSYSYGEGGADVWVFKLDSSGEQVWMQTFGGEGDDAAYDICLTPDGDYIVIGYEVADNRASTYLLRLSPNGELMWDRPLGDDWSWLVAVEATADGGFAAAGDSFNLITRNMDARVMKFDDFGNVEW